MQNQVQAPDQKVILSTPENDLALAKEFSKVATGWLTPAQVKKVNQINKVSNYEPEICGLFNFIDNPMEAMEISHKNIFGVILDDQHPDSFDLTYNAWDIARKNRFFAK